MQTIAKYQQEFLSFLSKNNVVKEPKSLYAPVNYILALGGKRLRPVLTLMAADIFCDSYKEALPAAYCVEMFHNFTLVHDDIMDDAPLRRGNVTVHEKWDINTGILSGDVMLIKAYQLLENYPLKTFKLLTSLFSKTAVEVCEGQQYDVDFESRTNVTIAEYLRMIEYKTAVLVAAAMQMGAIVANASLENQNQIYEFGKNLGIAFQLQDDYLDAFGNPETFGKQVGGDIIENKKTYLFLKAMEFSDSNTQKELITLFSSNPKNVNSKIDTAKHIFLESGAASATKEKIKDYTNKTFFILDELEISEGKKEILKTFGNNLMNRTM